MRLITMSRLMLSAFTILIVTNQAVAQRIQAFAGEPYGVASFSVPVPNAGDDNFADSYGFRLEQEQDRVLYPVYTIGQFSDIAGGIAQEFLGGSPIQIPNQLRVSFLFTGNSPFQVTLLTPRPITLTVQPQTRRPALYNVHFKRWWREYNANTRRQIDQGDYPPLVETYLTEMLSARLGLEPPLLSQRRESAMSQLQQTTQLLYGAEELRYATLRETMRGGNGVGEVASIPLPAEIEWTPVKLPEQTQPANVEKIAMHVPEECYYIRFGSFENYLWLDHLKDDYGGDISRMVTLRGHSTNLEQKVQQQLGLKKSANSELLGPSFISDVALIGTDLYLKEGPATGILFESKNNFALGASFNADRGSLLKEYKDQGATLEKVKIDERDVSYLSTPDNTLRSYYAVDGSYHFITTSRTLMERFLQAGQGERSLGASAEFQHARKVMPLKREDTVFAYFSSLFFRNLLSPRYQVELSRRLQSATNGELIQLATLTAQSEEQPYATVADLVQNGYLPPTFLNLPAANQPLSESTLDVDPERGRRGYFTPIPDVELTSITPTEAQLYDRSARYCTSHWPQMDPLLVGVKRYALDEEKRLERIVIDANVSPLVEEKYGWLLSMVGPPTDVQLVTNPGDVVSLQMSLKGGLLWPEIEPHHLFMGIQDTAVGQDLVPSGFMQTLNLIRTTPGFIGGWPQLGLLDMVPGLTFPPDVNGMSPLPLGLWRWQGKGFSTVSFNPDVLLNEAQFMDAIPSENHSQFRLRVGDITATQLAGWVTMLNYSRAHAASLGNVRLLNSLSQQLNTPQSEAMQLANKLLDTTLVCSLKGEYEIKDDSWYSTAWPEQGRLPQDYQAPLLEWFRGCTVDFSKDSAEMKVHVELDMLRKEREKPKAKLPSFNFFGK